MTDSVDSKEFSALLADVKDAMQRSADKDAFNYEYDASSPKDTNLIDCVDQNLLLQGWKGEFISEKYHGRGYVTVTIGYTRTSHWRCT